MATQMIVTRGLAKRYGEVAALDGIDLDIAAGSIYALLGPNGAGKTTTISILTTLALPSAGSAQVAGFDVTRQANEVRRRIGVTFQDLVLDPDLTGRQVLDIHGRLYRQPRELRQRRIAELVELVQLGDAIDRLVKGYSGGMKRRLELARGLMTDPQVLFLDEPTQGLDPQNRATIWDYIRMLRRERGLTLLLTTHYMEEAEALADTVGIIDRGHKVAEGAPAALAAELGADLIRISGRGDAAHLAERLRALPFVDRVTPLEHLIEVGVDNGSRRVAEVVAQASGNGFTIEDVAVARPSLGDVFLKYTGRALRD
ncbi:MAG TPA: ATP-binding cassette domain-containing protein [Kouleothrix sp.]|uniref:ATP-binding cassette domain-containing protein n=1 Tax=Kouleothrix sp. TaxID=2779161 RepID=UPI002CDDF0AE|nr:ATP-binding cassette domain-containing protein [Kouleothrix sp.]